MNQTLTTRIVATFLFCLAALISQAQYLFLDAPTPSSAGLGAYRQNFDGLASYNNYFTSNSTLLGVYARFTLNAYGGEYESYSRRGGVPSARLGGDNGSEGPKVSSVTSGGTAHGPAWYHFGTTGSTDRALGGIAGTSTSPGQGYVGIRLKNSSSKTIINLEVEYAMEQWYNSSRTQAAAVTVDYQRSNSAITSVFSGGWTKISELGVAAPSTSTAIAPRDGNAATNRRVLHTTLTGLNLKANEEIMLRFGYAFDSGTNGNGLSIDDVVITPQTNIFYSDDDDSKKLDSKSTWGTNEDGSGTAPSSFTTDNTTFYVCSKGSHAKRLAATWAVTGQNSKIVVGSGKKKAALCVGPTDNIVGTIDVNDNATLEIEHPANSLTLGSLHAGSTVEYINSSATTVQRISAGSYGTLTLTEDGARALAGPVLVRTAFNYERADTQPVQLGNYNLQLQKGADLKGPSRSATLLVTNGTGSLLRTVSGDAAKVEFPVGTSAASYSPVTLSQSGTGVEDTYSVRVIDGLYPNYTAAGAGVGTSVNNQNVKKTWFVEEEVAGNSNVTMAVQWNGDAAATNFRTATAHISHYIGGKWDTMPLTTSATGAGSGAYTVTRTGIDSFSPFAVTSRSNPLPVELTAFGAHRQGLAVACAWATASEKNSRSFVVERSSNGQLFEALGSVAAAGSSSASRNYSFTDAHPLPGLAYYRLRQQDLDGTESFSAVVAVAAEMTTADRQAVVVPNPGTGQFAVRTAAGEPLPGALVVRNVLGAEVLRCAAGTAGTSARFDLTTMPRGVYFVQVTLPNGPRTLRIVKE